jgi:clan AA aspartic protease
MGISFINIPVSNPRHPGKRTIVKCLIDTGATYSVISASILKKIGVKSDDEITLSLADGSEVTRPIGEARFSISGKSRVSPVIFGVKGDVNLLGVVTLEAMALFLDPLKRELLPLRALMAGLRKSRRA